MPSLTRMVLAALATGLSLSGTCVAQNSTTPAPAPAPTNLPPVLPGANITTSGNGCPQGAAGGRFVNATGDFSEMDFELHNFTAVYGNNSSVALRSTACETHIQVLDAPAGWQVSPTNFSASGFVVLDPGTTITVYFSVYWSDNAANTASFSKQYSNTGNNTITSLIEFYDNSSLWSDCITDADSLSPLNINFRAALTGVPNADGSLPYAYFGPLYLVGQETFTVSEDIGYTWQTC